MYYPNETWISQYSDVHRRCFLPEKGVKSREKSREGWHRQEHDRCWLSLASHGTVTGNGRPSIAWMKMGGKPEVFCYSQRKQLKFPLKYKALQPMISISASLRLLLLSFETPLGCFLFHRFPGRAYWVKILIIPSCFLAPKACQKWPRNMWNRKHPSQHAATPFLLLASDSLRPLRL